MLQLIDHIWEVFSRPVLWKNGLKPPTNKIIFFAAWKERRERSKGGIGKDGRRKEEYAPMQEKGEMAKKRKGAAPRRERERRNKLCSDCIYGMSSPTTDSIWTVQWSWRSYVQWCRDQPGTCTLPVSNGTRANLQSPPPAAWQLNSTHKNSIT